MTKHSNSERGGSGNFANDREKASEAGRKGGQSSHSGGSERPPSEDTSERGGSNFANDREKASEAGRKGGGHSHGSHSR
jgi:general stress protein YciG